MTFLQWRYTTKSTLIKPLNEYFEFGNVDWDTSETIESALEAAYRAGLKQGRKDASQLSAN